MALDNFHIPGIAISRIDTFLYDEFLACIAQPNMANFIFLVIEYNI